MRTTRPKQKRKIPAGPVGQWLASIATAKHLPHDSERDRLVTENLSLVPFIVRKLRSSVNEDDLQCGAMALIKAAETFDSERGVKFSTYACRLIRNEIIRLYTSSRKQCRDVSRERSYEGMIEEYGCRDAIDPRVDRNYDEATEAGSRHRRQVRIATAAMSDRERIFVRAYYDEGLTLKQVGQRFGITRERVRQIIGVALGKARQALSELQLLEVA